ncbi:uncharacterized protein SCODWIG_04003 [Saccharomycodes ludwigii]|uniref:Kinase n=1 Tax=Saccharomycodes ludwigii TaxID=36035 RepID=A0A376BDM4_9ASCO|nr:uncharacterized protein SCODWIG_04003 [Saccharomycodes ludwigii]
MLFDSSPELLNIDENAIVDEEEEKEEDEKQENITEDINNSNIGSATAPHTLETIQQSSSSTLIKTVSKGNQNQEKGRKKENPEEEDQDQEYPLAVELEPFNNKVGGHTAIFRFSKMAVCKALVNRENRWYENIELNHEDLLQFMPKYIGVLNVRQHYNSHEDMMKAMAKKKHKNKKQPHHSSSATSSEKNMTSVVIPVSRVVQILFQPLPTVHQTLEA